MQFTELKLHPHVMQGILDAGFVECTPVQAATFDKTLAGTDVYVQSQTGTGKTAAFLITIFNHFLEGQYRHKKALVLTPTRELAVQVEQDARLLGKHCDLKVGCFYGGVGYAVQDQALKENLNLYIGTPGRLIDYQKSGKIDFMKFEILVIDEADRMFDMGFIPDIRYMIKRMPQPQQRLTMLFSATLSQRVKQLAWEYMNDPAEIEINPEHLTVDLISQELYHIGREEKFNLLLGLIKNEKPKSALIFTNMKRTAERISRRLTANGIKNDYISGDLPQSKRLKIIDAIKAGNTEILVATDVAARGLHIEELDMVINYDLPEDAQNYVHRIGRTARAGKTGRAIALVSEQDVYCLEPIEKLIGMKIETRWADDNLIVGNAAGEQYERDGRRDRQRPRRDRDRRPQRDADRRPQRDADRRPQRDADRRPQGDARKKKFPENEKRSAAPAAARPEKKEQRPAASPAQHTASRDAVSGPSDKNRRRNRNRNKAAEAPPRQRQDKMRAGEKNFKLKKEATPEERLEYYRIKYGENFEKVQAADLVPKKPKPETLAGSIKKLFGKITGSKK